VSIGSDRWVETAESRTEGRRGWWGRGMRHWNSLPPLGRLGSLVALAALETRRRVLGELADSGARTAITHGAGPQAFRVAHDGSGGFRAVELDA